MNKTKTKNQTYDPDELRDDDDDDDELELDDSRFDFGLVDVSEWNERPPLRRRSSKREMKYLFKKKFFK
jgi:hypothetical protein